MRENVEGYQGPLTVLQFKGGQSNPTYRLDTPGRSYVMRRKPFGKLLPSAHAVDREYRVIAALGKQGFPVAQAYALCTDDSVIGAGLLHHVDGRGPGVLGSRRCRARRRRSGAQIFTSKIETLAKLHNYDPRGDRPRRFRQARQLFCAARSTAGPSSTAPPRPSTSRRFEKLVEWLPKTVPEQERVSIVHGDYRLDNMIFHADRAAGAGGAGLGAVDARRSAWPTSPIC